jgi:hypothetical protein
MTEISQQLKRGGIAPTTAPVAAQQVAGVVDMPRRPADLGSFSPRDETLAEKVAHPSRSTAYGLKQIDTADLSSYPTLRQVLERLSEIAAHIQKDTGLHLDLSRVSFDVCSGHDFARRAYKESSVRCGMAPEAIDEALKGGHPEHRKLSKQLGRMESQMLGVFMPTEEAILLNGDLLARGNANHVANVLYHELIHAAQFQNFPGFFSTLDAYGKLSVELSKKGLSDSREYRDTKDSLDACMQLLEGMPTSLQMENSKKYFPGASDGIGFFQKAWAVAQTLLTHEGRSTLVKYLGGALKYGAMQKASPHIDHLAYEFPELALIAGKKQGEVVLNLPDEIPGERLIQILAAAELLQRLNRGSQLQVAINIASGDQQSAVDGANAASAS